MPVHDYILSNQSGSSFRSDLNNALAAIVSQNSSATEPATTYSYQYWVDTSATPALVKQRNAANDDWVTLAEVDGQTLAADGTDAKPGISFAADVNTGLKRNAADDVSIVTGGTQAITVDSSQNVGVGTASPSSALHLSSSAPVVTITDTDTSAIHTINADSSGANVSINVDTTEVGDTDSKSSLIINTHGDERLRIQGGTGNVGIGTTSPGAKLEVQGETGSGSIAAHIKGGDGASTVGLVVDGDNETGDVLIKARSNSSANPTDSDTKFIVQGSGNVGIGTSSPGRKLHVVDSNNILRLESSSTASSRIEFENTGSSSGDSVSLGSVNNDMQFVTSSSERVRIKSSGNVGIGTSTPSAKLDVNGSLSKNSGSFKIDHPLPALAETHHLVHSFVEAPDASNLYAGMIDLVDGRATVNIDTAHRMTEGTFEALNTIQSWSSSNESGYAPVKCSISGNLLTIECQDATSTDTVYYEVRGIRKDQHMLDTEWTDENGRVITEPLKPAESNDEMETLETEVAALEAAN